MSINIVEKKFNPNIIKFIIKLKRDEEPYSLLTIRDKKTVIDLDRVSFLEIYGFENKNITFKKVKNNLVIKSLTDNLNICLLDFYLKWNNKNVQKCCDRVVFNI